MKIRPTKCYILHLNLNGDVPLCFERKPFKRFEIGLQLKVTAWDKLQQSIKFPTEKLKHLHVRCGSLLWINCYALISDWCVVCMNHQLVIDVLSVSMCEPWVSPVDAEVKLALVSQLRKQLLFRLSDSHALGKHCVHEELTRLGNRSTAPLYMLAPLTYRPLMISLHALLHVCNGAAPLNTLAMWHGCSQSAAWFLVTIINERWSMELRTKSYFTRQRSPFAKDQLVFCRDRRETARLMNQVKSCNV